MAEAGGTVPDHRRRQRHRGGHPAGAESTAPDGICTSTAIYFGEQPELPLLEMYTKIVTFKTGRVHARPIMPAVLDLAAHGTLCPELITTRVVDWPDAGEALLARDWTKLLMTRE